MSKIEIDINAVKPQAKVASLIIKRDDQQLVYVFVNYNRILFDKYQRASFEGYFWVGFKFHYISTLT